jgi:hypothetical protein
VTEGPRDKIAIKQRALPDAKIGLSQSHDTVTPSLPVETDLKTAWVENISNDEESTESFRTKLSINDEQVTAIATTARGTTLRDSKVATACRVAQVILGGLLALPLAQLVLWYWPWGAQDPFKLGAELSAFETVKWLVPTELHRSADEPLLK